MTTDNETTVAGEVQTLLIESGYPHCLNIENRFQAMTSLCLHGVLLSRKAELDQFLLGALLSILEKVGLLFGVSNKRLRRRNVLSETPRFLAI